MSHSANVDPRTIRTLRERPARPRPWPMPLTVNGRRRARIVLVVTKQRSRRLATCVSAISSVPLPGSQSGTPPSQPLTDRSSWAPCRRSWKRRLRGTTWPETRFILRGDAAGAGRWIAAPRSCRSLVLKSIGLLLNWGTNDFGRVSVYGIAVVFAAETGLRPEEWIALERRDIDLTERAVTVERAFSDGRLKDAKTLGSHRRVPLSQRAVDALEALPPRLDRRILFPAPKGGYLDLGNFRRRVWQPALESAGFVRCPVSEEHAVKRIGREYRCQNPDCRGQRVPTGSMTFGIRSHHGLSPRTSPCLRSRDSWARASRSSTGTTDTSFATPRIR